ncbi:hypothetical protein D3C80_563160 [compost metagenome]
MAVKGDLVANDTHLAIERVGFTGVYPGIRHMGQHLTLQIFINVFPQRHIFVIPQIRISLLLALGFTHFGGIVLLTQMAHQQLEGRGRQLDLTQQLGQLRFELVAREQLGLSELAQGCENGRLQGAIELGPSLIGGEAGKALGILRVECQFQRPLYGQAAIAKVRGGEDFGDRALFVAAVEADDLAQRFITQLLALGAQRFTHRAVQVTGIDQQHLALTLGRFVVRQHPDIGGNAGVVEHIGGQGHQCIQQVVLEDITADLTLATASPTGKER